MNPVKIIGITLIVVGFLSLVYGGFSRTRETQKTQETESGSLKVFVKDTQTLSIPVWVSVWAIMVGSLLLTLSPRKD
jgi:hypothetical protein